MAGAAFASCQSTEKDRADKEEDAEREKKLLDDGHAVYPSCDKWGSTVFELTETTICIKSVFHVVLIDRKSPNLSIPVL